MAFVVRHVSKPEPNSFVIKEEPVALLDLLDLAL